MELKRYYRVKGEREVRERYFLEPTSRQKVREGQTIRIIPTPMSQHHKVAGRTAKVIKRYLTCNFAFTNYGMVIQLLDGENKGKVYYVPMMPVEVLS